MMDNPWNSVDKGGCDPQAKANYVNELAKAVGKAEAAAKANIHPTQAVPVARRGNNPKSTT